MFLQPLFWLICFSCAVLMRTIGPNSDRLRCFVLFLASGLALSQILNQFDLVLLFVISAWLTLASFVLRYLKTRKMWVPLILLLPILCIWVTGKHDFGGLVTSHKWITFTGMSFILVKSWTLLKDSADGRIPVISFGWVLNYLAFFPCFVMGPMHGFNEFVEAAKNLESLTWQDAINIYYRIAIGLTKVYIVGPFLSPASLNALKDLPLTFDNLSVLIVGALVYSLVIYCDFSGYSDLAIATAKIIGIRTPENFAHPYLSPNIREFWNRWHITFSRVLTSYVFMPVSRTLTKRFPTNRRLVSTLGYLITFTICGYWHGSSIGFLVWGLYHAFGLAVYDAYRSYQRPNTLASRTARPLVSLISTAGTFLYVSIGWIPFVMAAK